MLCKWGVLGPGFIATRAVMPAIQHAPDARLMAVASRSNERAQTVAAQFNIERCYTDYQALLDDPEIQAVYIALPNHLHALWTIRAARAGKHVLCEKPLALSSAECDQMIAACRQANVLLMEAVMYRFHPRMIALKALVAHGELGEIHFLNAAFSFPFNALDNYRSQAEFGGGALLDVGSYCVNAVRWLSGSEPEMVQAHTSYSQGIDVSTSAILHFGQHTLAHIQCSFAAAEHQSLGVVGNVASVTAPLAFTAWRDDPTVLMVQRGATFEQQAFAPADPYLAMVNHFTDCMLGRVTPLYRPEDGRATIRALEMIKSASAG